MKMRMGKILKRTDLGPSRVSRPSLYIVNEFLINGTEKVSTVPNLSQDGSRWRLRVQAQVVYFVITLQGNFNVSNSWLARIVWKDCPEVKMAGLA